MDSAVFNTLGKTRLVFRFVTKVFPLVDRELAYWQQVAANSGCPELTSQALASIRDKRFHCQGGSIYCLYPGVDRTMFVKLVVALQTISDYLDNLCDRAGVANEQAFRQLHQAMSDALTPDAIPADYYRYYPYKNDGGYLQQLVTACQQQVASLPSYTIVKDHLLYFAGLYSDLQTYKHLDPALREAIMLAWLHRQHVPPGITDWEFAAATGSTLGMFMLCAAACQPKLSAQDAQTIAVAYFPWISGLHILLDYFIDGAEDRESNDLNFLFYYSGPEQALERLLHFRSQAKKQAGSLTIPAFTQTVIDGLLALYLSDPKTNTPQEKSIKKALLQSSGFSTNLLYFVCNLLRLQQKF